MAGTDQPVFAEATIGVGQSTTALPPGDAMVMPLPDGFTEICCTATEEAPIESETVAVIRYVPTALYV